MKRDPFIAFGFFIVVFAVLLVAGFLGTMTMIIIDSQENRPVQFEQTVSDRSVMEDTNALYEARVTGYSVFYFDGIQYVVEDLPEEYLKYSEWKCRMP